MKKKLKPLSRVEVQGDIGRIESTLSLLVELKLIPAPSSVSSYDIIWDLAEEAEAESVYQILRAKLSYKPFLVRLIVPWQSSTSNQ